MSVAEMGAVQPLVQNVVVVDAWGKNVSEALVQASESV
jgi:hypothetical protein